MLKDAESIKVRNNLGFIDTSNPLPIVISDGVETVDVNTNNELQVELSSTSDTNPLPIQDIDISERNSLNTVFGEKITGTRIPTLAAQFQYGITSDGSDVVTANGGSAATANSLLTISTGTNTAGAAYIQTREYLRYIPGHEAYMLFTAVFSSPKADSYQRSGLFDDDNGFFIGYEDTDFVITRRRVGVDEKQIIDISGIYEDGTFDPTKGNVYRISFGYLGFATIHFEVMKPSGAWTLIGEFKYPNTATVTHIAQTNLPARGQVANIGNDTDIVIKSGSFTFGIVDGGDTDPSARLFSASLPTTTITVGNFLIGIFRNKTTFNSIENRIKAHLMLISAATDLSKISSWKLLRNATITNSPTWIDANTADSIMEYSTDATIDFNTGDDLIPWSMSKVDSFFEQVEEQLIQIRPGETSAIVLTTPVGTSGTVETAFRWKELF